MAVTIAEITKLRKLSGAGMMDCKKALEESNGDIEKAMEIIRKKGQAVAAKRSDREASEGCVLVKAENGFGAIIALKCETDFVAKNEDFVKLNQQIIDAAVAAKAKSLDEIKGLMLGNETVADAIIARSGITGEKTRRLFVYRKRQYFNLRPPGQTHALHHGSAEQSCRPSIWPRRSYANRSNESYFDKQRRCSRGRSSA